MTETTTGGESADQRSPHTDDDDINHKSYFDVLNPRPTDVRPSSPSNPTLEVSGLTHGKHGLASSNPADSMASASLQTPQLPDLDADPLQDFKVDAGTIKRALLRASRARKEVDPGTFTLTQESGETQTEHGLPQESFKASENYGMDEEESAHNREKVLLGYDAQWCWVESQDDVTFL